MGTTSSSAPKVNPLRPPSTLSGCLSFLSLAAYGRPRSVTTSSQVSHNRPRRSIRPEFVPKALGRSCALFCVGTPSPLRVAACAPRPQSGPSRHRFTHAPGLQDRPEAAPSTPWRAMTPPPRLPASWGANYYPVGLPQSRVNASNASHLDSVLYYGKLRAFKHKLSICCSACDDIQPTGHGLEDCMHRGCAYFGVLSCGKQFAKRPDRCA